MAPMPSRNVTRGRARILLLVFVRVIRRGPESVGCTLRSDGKALEHLSHNASIRNCCGTNQGKSSESSMSGTAPAAVCVRVRVCVRERERQIEKERERERERERD